MSGSIDCGAPIQQNVNRVLRRSEETLEEMHTENVVILYDSNSMTSLKRDSKDQWVRCSEEEEGMNMWKKGICEAARSILYDNVINGVIQKLATILCQNPQNLGHPE